jgi:type IV secretion system protein VirD4
VSVSEQGRPLLLPQEVQALKSDEAIVFYEGLRPIRCKKIRYFNERRFKRLIAPPPRHASPALARGDAPAFPPVAPRRAGAAAESAAAAPTETTASPSPRKRRGRRAAPADLEQLESLTLEDFDVDLSRVVLPQKPAGERLTKEELDTAVESFVAALHER